MPLAERSVPCPNLRNGPAIQPLLATALFGLGASLALDPARAQEPSPAVRYDRDIRPILADRCFKCHGRDGKSRERDLRLDLQESATATRDGVVAIAPRNLQGSELWRRITAVDPDDVMPPPTSGKRPIDAGERRLLAAWIEQGAVYEPHWSFVPPQRPPVPSVRRTDAVRNEIDAFVVAALEQRGIEPSPPADSSTLVRRLYLALTGLPPTPAEVGAFQSDPGADAYDRLVDRLLTEEPYVSRHAEHLATPWLDAARYADTCGIHMDAGRQMWAYRDWVLAAFRDNLPFDQFVVDQLAGDLVPGATQAQRVASGFHRCHVTTDEGGAIAEEYLVEYAVDRTATTGSVFLGLTLGCARCHEHKYDPVSQEDFYRLYSYFNSIEEPGLYSQVPDANRALEPFLAVPNAAQAAEQQTVAEQLEAAQAALDAPAPAEEALQAGFVADLRQRTGLRWQPSTAVAATSQLGATMTIEPDGSVRASGANPKQDVHEIRLATAATDLRLLCLQALPEPTQTEGRVGRAQNGNAVLMAIEVEAIAIADPHRRQKVPLDWAWADIEQGNSDFRVVNALAADDGAGWAVDAHMRPAGPRTALFLAAEPFGYPGGTEIVVTLRYDSIYGQHVFGRVRLTLGSLADTGVELLPVARSGLYVVGPFPVDAKADAYEQPHGPEQATTFDRRARFEVAGKEPVGWEFQAGHGEGVVNTLAEGVGTTYVAQRLLVPTARTQRLSLGSDDGFQLHLDGRKVHERRVDRSVAADQDQVEVALTRGEHLLVLEVVNTGGASGYALRAVPREADSTPELAGDLVAALLPEPELAGVADRLRVAWRLRFSPDYAARRDRVRTLEQRRADLDKAIPRTMVMQELPQPRATFVLVRGEYSQPDRNHPVTRGIPAALGRLPADAPDNRLGLAQWLVAADNPLVARVRANRLWEFLFGQGLVRTTEDLGMQGEWPNHPELLDWLAVELRERGWDQRALLRTIVRSATFRQRGQVRPDVRERDPDNLWLSWYPRRRLSAEQLRDQALYTAGTLIEHFGGPSVKPYQPDGLWREVAMVQSNTRDYQRGDGDALFRRSLYTYWKRACPPPSMLTFDAPTREFCTIRRSSTNTPLQALVLWNDEQFVEAARLLAARTLAAPGDDGARLAELFTRCTARAPDAAQLQRLQQALDGFRDRYRAAPADAAALLAVGELPVDPAIDAAELAAWTLVASAISNLDATICLP